MRLRGRAIFLALWSCVPMAQAVTEEDVWALSMEELGKIQVTIATGTPKTLVNAPSVTSVITAAELRAMGAQTLEEALEAIPGLHVSRGSFAYAPRYFIRGITSVFNPHTLPLVNGIPQTSLFVGDRGERVSNRYSLPVAMIERIEIIRGPGSAVYGADAFSGVINVITKGPDDVESGHLTVSAGSFGTGEASFQQAGHVGSLRSLFSLGYYQTDGDRRAVMSSDAQSNVDALGFAPPASLAPGPVETSTRFYDARLDLIWNDVRLRTSWMRAWDVGTGQGIADARDPNGRFTTQRGNIDISWSKPELTQDWALETQLSYFYNTFENPSPISLFPSGAFFGSFPQGVTGQPGLKEENARAGLTALYRGWESHRLRVGAGFHWGDVFETTDIRNFIQIPGPLPIVPRPGGSANMSDTPEAYLPENQRTSYHLFAQDEWAVAPGWEIIAGVRYDNFDDVGDTLNPRAAVVWQTTPTFTSKLLYGEAFRPPAFFELYATSNPVALGNPDLQPEKLRNAELAFSWRPQVEWALDINLYQFRIRDYIDFLPDPGGVTFTARNANRIRGRGLEMEVRHQLGAPVQVLMNYSHQQTEDESTGRPLGLAPSAEAFFRAIWAMAPGWQLTPQLNWAGERKRAAGDMRAALPGYTTFDVAVRKSWAGEFELALIGHNLFDADVREASRGPNAGQPVPNIANDLPQAGRSVTLEGRVRW